MASNNTSSMTVHKIFRSLLSDTSSPAVQQRLSVSAAAASVPPPPPPQPLTSPPPKYSIRFIENDPDNRREKYDGCRWRLACTWGGQECTNLAYSYQLCPKHNATRQNREPRKKKKKLLFSHLSLPIMGQHGRNNVVCDEDDDIEIIEEIGVSSRARHSVNSNIKAEGPDFNVFSVDHFDEAIPMNSVKSEPTSSSNCRSSSSNEIQYISSTVRTNGLNVGELVNKNIPPLTDFEEECIGYRLMEKLPTNCLMVDAQLFIHNEAIAVVQKNYRQKMDSVAPEYFYDFLLRNPRVPLHYRNWFLRCKPVPPTTGCPIDTKVWTLSMIVRGAMANNR